MGKVEEVARALSASDGANWDAKTDSETANGCTPDEQRDYWREKARAAIEAMREPTQAMTKVAADDILEGPGISAFLNWQDLSASRYRLMIDAALSEEQG